MVKILLGTPYPTHRIRAIEENTVYLGLPLRLLMESAGKCVAEETERIREKKGLEKKVLIVAGKGGNAGDGFVVARYLLNYGYKVTVALLFDPSSIQHPDSKENFALIEKASNIEILYPWSSIIEETMDKYDIIIDAILGTGVKGELRQPVASAIQAINSSEKTIISIDVPSGVDPDTGVPASYNKTPLSVKADYTVVMHYKKIGLTGDNEYTGRQVICNIGIPPEAEMIVGPGDVKHLLKKKSKEAKKGDGGKILVIGGSFDYTGAPALAGIAALKAGADLVYIVTPSEIRHIVASYSPEIITKGVGKTYFSKEDVKELLPLINIATSIVLGPGLSYKPETCEFTSTLIRLLREKSYDIPLIIDADALKCAGDQRITFNKKTVLTPHRGELSLLAEKYGSEKLQDRMQAAMKVSELTGAVVLSKGPIDYICYKKTCRINRTGNPGMSVGGTGDILTGLVAAFANRTDDLVSAASIAAFINGSAADMVYKEQGEFFTPQDILDKIPYSIHKFV